MTFNLLTLNNVIREMRKMKPNKNNGEIVRLHKTMRSDFNDFDDQVAEYFYTTIGY